MYIYIYIYENIQKSTPQPLIPSPLICFKMMFSYILDLIETKKMQLTSIFGASLSYIALHWKTSKFSIGQG